MDKVKFYRVLGRVFKYILITSAIILFAAVLSNIHLSDNGKMAIIAWINKYIYYYGPISVDTYKELQPVVVFCAFFLMVISAFGMVYAVSSTPQYPKLYRNQKSKFKTSIFIMKFVVPIIVPTLVAWKYGAFSYGIVAGIAVSIVLFGLVMLVLSGQVLQRQNSMMRTFEELGFKTQKDILNGLTATGEYAGVCINAYYGAAYKSNNQSSNLLIIETPTHEQTLEFDIEPQVSGKKQEKVPLPLLNEDLEDIEAASNDVSRAESLISSNWDNVKKLIGYNCKLSLYHGKGSKNYTYADGNKLQFITIDSVSPREVKKKLEAITALAMSVDSGVSVGSSLRSE